VRFQKFDVFPGGAPKAGLLCLTFVKGDNAVKIRGELKTAQSKFCLKSWPATGNAQPQLPVEGLEDLGGDQTFFPKMETGASIKKPLKMVMTFELISQINFLEDSLNEILSVEIPGSVDPSVPGGCRDLPQGPSDSRETSSRGLHRFDERREFFLSRQENVREGTSRRGPSEVPNGLLQPGEPTFSGRGRKIGEGKQIQEQAGG